LAVGLSGARKFRIFFQLESLVIQLKLTEKEIEMERNHRNRIHSEEASFLSKTNLQLKRQIEGIQSLKE
jgi:hypothetical protein